MTDRERDPSLFRDELYKLAITEIGTLKDKLPDEAFAGLAREVIRRLSDHPAARTSSVSFPSDEIIDALTEALLEPGAEAGIAFIARVRAQGASVETVYIAYLAAAARTLGKWWEEDKIDFAEVTIGTGHIYAVMRGLKPLFRPNVLTPDQPTAFFTAVPGENHQLGISMATDVFRKAGWDIAFKRGLDHDELVQYAALSGVTLIGISAGSEYSLPKLARLIVALRISVPETSLMVGGAILDTSRAEAEAMGIDILPSSMEDALEQARNIWDQAIERVNVS